jgi:putative component of toxin-antitoxin plasmid stabilization module
MKSSKDSAHAFIVRIWMETRELKDAEPIWRGVIEHVGSGARIYFDKLEQIAIHVMPYLEAMGIKLDKHKSK